MRAKLWLLTPLLVVALVGCEGIDDGVVWRAMVEDDKSAFGWYNFIFPDTYKTHRDCYEIISHWNPGKKSSVPQ